LISIKKIKSCNRKEIDTIYNFLWKLILERKKTNLQKIKKIIVIWLCKTNNNIIGISAIKKPGENLIKKIINKSWWAINQNYYEYWYIYVQPKHRWHWITKKIYQKLNKKMKNVYATVRENNYPMEKLLQKFWFSKKWFFLSNIDWKKINIYLK